jgi:hypothetical protein
MQWPTCGQHVWYSSLVSGVLGILRINCSMQDGVVWIVDQGT